MTDSGRRSGLLERLKALLSMMLPRPPGDEEPIEGLTEDERAEAHQQQVQIDNLQQRTKGPFPPA
ncbi:MAG TPA: hypothetical protein VIC63_00975 [Candidatus Limnocylindria bacterium]|jgi:hypothetical protein